MLRIVILSQETYGRLSIYSRIRDFFEAQEIPQNMGALTEKAELFFP